MVDTKLVGIGVTAACASLLLLYLYKHSTKKEKPKRSNVKKLMSRYKAEANEEDKPAEGTEGYKPAEGTEGYKPDIYDGLKAEVVGDDLARAVGGEEVVTDDMPCLVTIEVEEVQHTESCPQQTESQQQPSESPVNQEKVQQDRTSTESGDQSTEQHIAGPSTDQSSSNGPSRAQGCIASAVADQHIAAGVPDRGELVRAVVRAEDSIKKSEHCELIEQCFNIPTKAVGKIIGKQGANIKGLQRNTGARLQFPDRRSGGNAQTQKLFVKGTLRQISMAVEQLVAIMPADSMCHELISWTPESALEGDLKPIELVENTTCIGRGTHVMSPASVWIQVCRDAKGVDYTPQLGNLTDNITETLSRKMYDLKSAFLPDPKPGSSCAVMFEGQAFRASVITVARQDNEMHYVRMVDWGTPHSFSELYRLSPYYTNMPGLAVQCRLAHLERLPEDAEWPVEAAEYLEGLLRKGFVKVKVVEGGPIPAVELFLEDSVESPVYVNQELVYNRYAQWKEEL